MAEEKKVWWLNCLALTTVVFAVCATLLTLKGGGFSTRAVLSQSQASDPWSYFQAKSIKGYLYELQKEKLELGLRNVKGRFRSEYEKKIDGYAQKIRKYDVERTEIKNKAEELERTRDRSQKHSGAFGMAAMFLQIAILISSIAALMKRNLFWYIGMGGGELRFAFFLQRIFPVHAIGPLHSAILRPPD